MNASTFKNPDITVITLVETPWNREVYAAKNEHGVLAQVHKVFDYKSLVPEMWTSRSGADSRFNVHTDTSLYMTESEFNAYLSQSNYEVKL